MTDRVPFTPPRFAPVDTCGGRIGSDPRHFVVEEIPAYPLSGEGEHVFVWVEKTGRNTKDVAKRLAQVADMKERDVGYAGMKDKNAITRQWFSLCTKKDDAATWDLGEGVRVLEATRHGNKLRTGHLIGNRFAITLVDVPEGGAERAEKIAAHLRDNGLPNYYGSQRFGREGRNLEQAFAWLDEARDAPAPAEAPRDKKRGKGRGKKGGRFENKLLPSVLQSEIFNRYLAARLSDETELLLGEVVRLEGTGTHFVVENVEDELPRYREKDLHLTGPMIGPKGIQATEAARQLEDRICGQLGLSEEQLTTLGKNAPGARRDLLLAPEGMVVEAPNKNELQVSFSLPSGAYATQVIREFIGGDWMNPRS